MLESCWHMVSVLYSNVHDEAVNEEHSTQWLDSAHGQVQIPLLVPVKNTPIGHYLKVTKSQIIPPNLIPCWSVSCAFSAISDVCFHLVPKLPFTAPTGFPSLSDMSVWCRCLGWSRTFKNSLGCTTEAPKLLPLCWHRRRLGIEQPAFPNLVLCFFHSCSF